MGQSQDKSRTPQATGQTDSASRRAVLAGAGGVAAWAMLPGKSFAQKIAKPGAGQRVNVAVIGAGGKGADNMAQLTSQNIVAMCDVDMGRVSRSLSNKDGIKPEMVELKSAYDKAEQFADKEAMERLREGGFKDLDELCMEVLAGKKTLVCPSSQRTR